MFLGEAFHVIPEIHWLLEQSAERPFLAHQVYFTNQYPAEGMAEPQHWKGS